MFEVLLAQPVEACNKGLGRGVLRHVLHWAAAATEDAGQLRELLELGGRVRDERYGQPRDECNCYVRVHAHPYEIVRDEAVQQRAEDMLSLSRQESLQA